MYMLCHQIIIHSEKGKEEIIDLYGVDAKKVHVIPHGDYKFFVPGLILTKTKAKRKLDIDIRCKTILFFGAIRENKGLSNILCAMPFIKDKLPSVKLLVVGEPWEDYAKYKKIINEKNLEKYVWEKLVYVSNEELPLYFFASDLVVLPYHEITGSGILQVAYAFSKPVVASDLPGFRETVVDGENGYLVPPKDYGNMAEKIVDILLDDLKQEKMGEYSRFLADTKYSWDTIAGNTKAVYNKLLS